MVRRCELSYWAASAKKIEKWIWKIRPKTNKNKKIYRADALCRRCLLSGRFCSAWAGFFDLTGPVFLSQGKRNRPPAQAPGFARAASLALLVRVLGPSPLHCCRFPSRGKGVGSPASRHISRCILIFIASIRAYSPQTLPPSSSVNTSATAKTPHFCGVLGTV